MTSGFAALCLAIAALHLLTILNPHQSGAGAGGTMTGAADEEEVPLLHSAAKVLPPFAALGVFFAAVAFTYRHLMARRHGGGGGGGTRRRSISDSGLVMFTLCVSAGTLEFFLFGGQAAAGGAAVEGHRALGLAALRALPAAATATFFLGVMLIIVGHVRAGGEGGGTGGAVAAADGQIKGKTRLLLLVTKIAAGAAAALLVGLMAMALTLTLTLTLYGGAKC